MFKDIQINIRIVPATNFNIVLEESESEHTITEMPLVRDYTSCTESFIPS